MIRWRVFRAREHWPPIVSELPWTVLRPAPPDEVAVDGVLWNAHSHWATWRGAYDAAYLAASVEAS